MVASSNCENVHVNAVVRAGLYLRVSRDRTGLRLAVQRQEDDCRQVATRLGWSVAGMYVDNDLGASGFATKPRAGYKRLLDDLEAQRLDAVVVWMEDRSHRQVIELAEFVRTCRAAGIKRYASAGSEYDLSDPDQVTTLFFKARMAEAEVEKISVRAKRKLRELADSGKYHGGPKPYGYEGPTKDEHGAILNRGRAGKAIVDKEAAIIRETAQRVLDGDTLRSIVIDLNRRSVPAPRANLWTRRTLKVILTNPRVAGLRQHQGVIVGKANWPAILDRDTWERVRNVLLSLDRGPARTTSRSYLLSGFIFCGKCDRRLACVLTRAPVVGVVSSAGRDVARPPCDPSDNQEQGHEGDDGGRALECAPIGAACLPRPSWGAGTPASLPCRAARLLHPPRRCAAGLGRCAAERPRAGRVAAAAEPGAGPPARLGQHLRRTGPRTDRHRAAAGAVGALPARR